MPPPDPVAALVERATSALEQHLDEGRPGWHEDDRLVRAARALSEGFTTAPDELTPLLDDDRAAAYLAYFAPRTVAAVAHVLAPFAEGGAPRAVLDVGAGTGAASLCALAAGAERVLVADRDPLALDEALLLLRRLAPRASLARTSGDLFSQGVIDDRAELLLSAFAVGELLAAHPVEETLERLLAAAPRARALVLLDAGDRTRARGLQELREAALARGLSVRAPCPHGDPCPALARRRDWCHTRVERHLTPRLAAFARAVGRDEEQMSLSYLVLERAPRAPERHVRVLGEPLVEKGRVRLPVCGPEGLRFVQSLKRHKEARAALLSLERGARLREVHAERRGDTAHVGEANELTTAAEEGTLGFP